VKPDFHVRRKRPHLSDSRVVSIQPSASVDADLWFLTFANINNTGFEFPLASPPWGLIC
jgi:hypothetical protein